MDLVFAEHAPPAYLQTSLHGTKSKPFVRLLHAFAPKAMPYLLRESTVGKARIASICGRKHRVSMRDVSFLQTVLCDLLRILWRLQTYKGFLESSSHTLFSEESIPAVPPCGDDM